MNDRSEQYGQMDYMEGSPPELSLTDRSRIARYAPRLYQIN